MEGVYIDGIDNIISKLRDIEENSKNFFKGIDNSFELLNECYHGSDLDVILRRPSRSSINFTSIVKNYRSILEGVKKSYINQDEIFREQLNHINSNNGEV